MTLKRRKRRVDTMRELYIVGGVLFRAVK